MEKKLFLKNLIKLIYCNGKKKEQEIVYSCIAFTLGNNVSNIKKVQKNILNLKDLNLNRF